MTDPTDAPLPTGLALVFPGQGAQTPGMGEAWRDTAGWALVPQLSEWSGQDVAELLLTADADTLRRTDFAQLSIFAMSMIALAGVPTGDAVGFAGHSLGEFSALVAAGALDLADATRLVTARGSAMRTATLTEPGTMAAVLGASADEVAALVAEVTLAGGGDGGGAGGRAWVANVNAPGQVVVAGTPDGIERLIELGARDKRRVVRLEVSGAFHSELMAPAVPAVTEALATATFAGTHRPVVANVDAAVHTAGADWPDLLRRQVTAPVLWEPSVRTLTGQLGAGRFVEVGPGKALAGMIKRIVKGAEVSGAQPA